MPSLWRQAPPSALPLKSSTNVGVQPAGVGGAAAWAVIDTANVVPASASAEATASRLWRILAGGLGRVGAGGLAGLMVDLFWPELAGTVPSRPAGA